MTFQGPDALYDSTAASRILARYYEGWDTHSFRFTGSQFDGWPGNEKNTFTADDLVAVSFLSVEVPPRAAHELLRTRAADFNGMLETVPSDKHLADAEHIDESWWDLMGALKALPGVGPTMASKLFARKRPLLRPIYDSVVEAYLGPDKQQWEPLHRHLTVQRPDLPALLEAAIEAAEDIPDISPLRALDVVCWMCAR